LIVMPAKKPAKPTRLQVKADKKDKVLTGPKGSKPQSTTTNRVRTQGGTTMSKPKPAPSAGRRTNPKAAKPKPAPKPAAKPATPSGGGRNLFGGAGNKPAAINKADSQKAPKPAFRTSRAPLSGNGPFGTRRSARPSLGNVKPGPAAAAAPRQQAQAQGQANVRAAQQRRENLARVQRDLRGQVGKAASVLSGPAALARQAIAESVAPRPTAKGTLKGGGAVGPNMPKRLQQQGLNAQETKARQSLTARKKATGSKEATPNTAASFDDAFRDARRAKVKTFTWRGKKYTTEMK
jgi:translation initiation factor IF-2